MEWCFNDISYENGILKTSELETINYYKSIMNELCITCYIIIEDKIKYFSERRNRFGPSNAIEKYLETEPMCNIKSIICTSCINKLSNTSTLSTDAVFENLQHEYLIFPEETEKQRCLMSNENSSLSENQVSYNRKISSSASKIIDQQVSFVEDIQCTQTERPISEPWVCNDCMKQFFTREALFNHMESSDHMKIGINGSQIPQMEPPISVSNFPSIDRYECGNCALKFYSSHDFENHNCEPSISENLSTETEQRHGNANFNPDLLNLKKMFASHSENNYVPKTHHISENSQRTPHDIQNNNQSNLFYKDLTEKVISRNLEFNKDFISFQKVRTCNDNTAAFTSDSKRDKHSMKPYSCHLCSKGFIRKILLRDHIKSHCLKTTTCSNKEITEYNQVDGIYKKQKEENSIHKCNICNKTFNFKQALTRHFSKHEKRFPVRCFKCLTCQEVFPFEQYARSHILDGCRAQIFSESGNSLEQYEEIKIYKFLICEYCIKGFETVDELNNHRKTHKGHYLFFCTLCQKKYQTYWKLRCHQRSHKYSEEYKQFLELRRVFICQFCSSGVSSYAAFKQHLSKHQEEFNSHTYKTIKSLQTKKNISKCVQEVKRRKSLKNTVVRKGVTDSSFTSKGAKERNCKEIVVKIISCNSKHDKETKECFVDQAEERKGYNPLNLQKVITFYPPYYLPEEISNDQCKQISNQVANTNNFCQHSNQTKEKHTLSCHSSNKQQVKTIYQSNHLQEEINNNKCNENFNQIIQCTEFIQDNEREHLSFNCNVKQHKPTNLVKDHPRRRLHDCKFCSKRFKKACNLVRHMQGKHA